MSAAQEPNQTPLVPCADSETIPILIVGSSEIPLSALLDGAGFRWIEATSPTTALAQALEQEYAIILVDLRIPGSEGLETARRIRRCELARHTPILFLAGRELSPDQIQAGSALGAVDYHFDPGPPELLLGKVSLLVGLFRARRDLARQVDERIAELRRSEEELADFFENLAIGCHWVGPDGRILRANQTELRMLGYGRDEYVGQPIAKFHADSRAIDDILRRLADHEEVHDYPSRMRCKDGSLKDVLIDSNVHFRDGRFVHTRCFTRDITRQRRAEEASLLLAAVIQSTEDAVVTKTLDGKITSWNAGAQRVFGYLSEEIVGKDIRILIPPDRVEEEDRILAKVRRGERIEHYESVRIRKDGRPVDVSLTISPVKDGEGRIVGASKIARDITDRKREAADIARLHQLSSLLASSLDLDRVVHDLLVSILELQGAEMGLVSLVDAERDVLRLVASAGYSPHLLQGLAAVPIAEGSWTCGTAAARRTSLWIGDLEAETGFAPLREFARSAGVRAVWSVPLIGRGGKPLGVLSLHYRNPRSPSPREAQLVELYASQAAHFVENANLYQQARQELAHRKAQEQEILRLNASLEQRVRERTASLEELVRELNTFAYTVAHDLRAPLRAMHSFSQIVMEDYESRLDEGGRDLLRRIALAGKKMDRLITDLLSYSRLAREEMPIERVDTRAVLEESLELLASELRQRRAKVEVPSRLPSVTGNPVALRQVLTNLIQNAAKFVAGGAEPRITVNVEERPGRVRIWVADNGIGIHPDHHERIFGVFQRLCGEEEYPGTGIGLSIVKKAVDRMGGGVGLESELGRGSRFWIELPAAGPGSTSGKGGPGDA